MTTKTISATLTTLLVSGCLLNSQYERPDWSLEYNGVLSYASAVRDDNEALFFHLEVVKALKAHNIDYLFHGRAMTTLLVRKDQETEALELLAPLVEKYKGRIIIR